MALMYTPPAELGQQCPNFQLAGVDGRTYNLSDFASAPVLVVMFLCNHCPYVQAVESRVLDLAKTLSPRGAHFVAVSSNDAQDYPEDSFENLAKTWVTKAYPFPYLYDPTQVTAKAFGAVCTPDFFVYGKDRRLVYRGRLDDSWKDSASVTRQELRDAIVSELEGREPCRQQNPSMGCSIKWSKS